MKNSKRYIKKQQKKELINKKALKYILKENNICRHAIKELKLAGYGDGKGRANDWMYQQVLEAIAVFASHNNSGSSAPIEINLVNKLCKFDIISPLHFTDNEWNLIGFDGVRQNNRKLDVFKNPDGTINYNGAFVKQPIKKYNFYNKSWTELKNSIKYRGGLFIHKNNIFTGKYFINCFLWKYDIEHGWTPKPTRTIECIEAEIAQDYWITATDSDNINLLLLSCDYNIQWKNCPCLKGVKIEDVTPELIEKAFEEIKK